MTHYLSIGAARIQEWLGYTPKLTQLRGASAALHTLTGEAAVQGWLNQTGRSDLEIDPGPTGIDGVVVLKAPDAGSARTAAADLVSQLSTQLPGVQWEGWWVEASSYISAVTRAKDDTDIGVERIRGLADVLDLGLIQSCEACRREPAGLGSPGKPLTADLGRGCRIRQDHAGRPDDVWLTVPGAWADDFEDLAAQGGVSAGGPGDARAVGRTDLRNHLATIAADGNRIGDFFDQLDKTPGVPELAKSAVGELNATTRWAVEMAALKAGDGDAQVKGGIPHYVGGDDVLVSVPAPQAWRYAAALASYFDELRGTLDTLLTTEVGPSDTDTPDVTLLRAKIDQLSLGIGMCFAESHTPFIDTRALAEQALSAAKRATTGHASAIGWVDLTVGETDGVGSDSRQRGDTVPGRGGRSGTHTIRAEEATRDLQSPDDSLFDQVCALAPSSRSALSGLIRAASSEAEARAAVIDWKRRSRGTLSVPGGIRDLESALSRSRWWPSANRDEA